MSEGEVFVQGDYVAVAMDEPSVYETFLGERKREFSFPFITSLEAQEVADELLAQNKRLKVYYDCKLRGNPYIHLLDKSILTAPKCSVSNLQCQIVRVDHTVEAGHWETIVSVVADLVQVAKIMHLDKVPPDHLNAGYYIDQTK